LIADYWIVRRTQLQLEDLYLSDGVYRYTAGWHLPGAIATLAGCAAAWGGLIIPALRPLYDYAWFVGFGVAAGVYLALARDARATPPSVPGC